MLLNQHDFKSRFESGEYISGVGVRRENTYYITLTYYPFFNSIDDWKYNIKLTINETDIVEYIIIYKSGKTMGEGTTHIMNPFNKESAGLKKTLSKHYYFSDDVAEYIDIIAAHYNLLARKLAEENNSTNAVVAEA